MSSQKQEIIWNVINSFLAGVLVFLGGIANGSELTGRLLIFTFVTGAIVALTKFRDYWLSQEGEYTHKIFNFI